MGEPREVDASRSVRSAGAIYLVRPETSDEVHVRQVTSATAAGTRLSGEHVDRKCAFDGHCRGHGSRYSCGNDILPALVEG